MSPFISNGAMHDIIKPNSLILNIPMYLPYSILLFGNTYECWRVAQFYKNLPIEANSPECESIRQKNYICGCSDSAGYAGANTEAKQIALAWLPRIGAILSILVSDNGFDCAMGFSDCFLMNIFCVLYH